MFVMKVVEERLLLTQREQGTFAQPVVRQQEVILERRLLQQRLQLAHLSGVI
jgi:hypothetical protein